MTESEWFSNDDPARMLEFVRNPAHSGTMAGQPYASDRKLRLFACACCRQVWNHLTSGEKYLVDVVERFADGDSLLSTVMTARRQATVEEGWVWCASGLDIAVCIRQTVYHASLGSPLFISPPRPKQAALLRDIFGNPFSDKWQVRWGTAHEHAKGCAPKEAAWLTPTVLAIAQAIYDERAFDRMPILADALEEAGCQDEAILRHCRGEESCWCCRASFPAGSHDLCSVCCPGKETLGKATGWAPLRGPHVRGCFVLDLILGRS